MKNYVCPKCDSQLLAYREYIFEKRKLINPKTGKLNKTTTKTGAEKVDTCGGLMCSKCNFIYYGLSCESNERGRVNYKDLDELLDLINNDENREDIE